MVKRPCNAHFLATQWCSGYNVGLANVVGGSITSHDTAWLFLR